MIAAEILTEHYEQLRVSDALEHALDDRHTLGAALVTFNLRIDDIHPAQPVTFKLRPTAKRTFRGSSGRPSN